MSFLSGLGNIFHSIGHFFEGDDEKKKEEQQAQQFHPAVAPAPAPVNNQPAFDPAHLTVPLQKYDPNAVTEGVFGDHIFDPSKLPKYTPQPLPVAPAVNPDHRNLGEKLYDQFNPADSDRSFKNPNPSTGGDESAIHQLTHSGLNNAVGSVVNNIVPVSAAIDTGRLGWDEALHKMGDHNQGAIDNASQSLEKNVGRWAPIAAAETFKNGFGQDISTAITEPYNSHLAQQAADEVRREFPKTGDEVHDSAVEAYALATQEEMLRDHLATAGITPEMTTSQTAKHVIGHAGATAADVIFMSQMGNGLIKAPLASAEDGLVGSLEGDAGGAAAEDVEQTLKDKALHAGATGSAAAAANVFNTIGNNPDASAADLVKAGSKGFATGAAGSALLNGIGLIKAPSVPEELRPGITASDELAPGVKSTNPTQISDAVEQATAKAAQQVVPQEVPVSKAVPAAKAEPTVIEQGGQRPAAEIQKAIEDAHNAGDLAKQAELVGQLPEDMQAPMRSALGMPDPKAAAPPDVPEIKSSRSMEMGKPSVKGNSNAVYGTDNPNLQQILRSAIVAAKGTAKTAGEHADALAEAGFTPADIRAIRDYAVSAADDSGQVKSAGLKAFIQQRLTPDEAPSAAPKTGAPAADAAEAGPTTGRTAENAPKFREQLLKQLGDAAKGLPKNPSAHDVFSNPELTAAGKQLTDTMSDEELVTRFGNATKFSNASDAALGNAALDRLATLVERGTPDVQKGAQAAVDNILDAATELQSRSGRALNYGQEMLNHLPPAVKTAYYIKRLDALNDAKLGDSYEKIAADPAKYKAVAATFDQFFSKDAELNSAIADQKSTLEAEINRETRAGTDPKALSDAKTTLQDLTKQRNLNGGDMARFYDSLTPGRSKTDMMGDWQRTAMLSSPTGRISALITTATSLLDEGLKRTVAGGLGKAHNVFASPENAVRDTGLSPVTLAKGFGKGLKETVDEMRGKIQIENPEKALKGNTDMNPSEMSAFHGGKFKQVVRAMTGLHSKLTQGVKDAELERGARQEGLTEGLKGEDLDKFVTARSALPTASEAARSTEAWETVNNLNNNPLTSALRDMGNAFEKRGGPLGKVVKNQILPFPTWLGGNIWNSLTDRNVVAAAVKVVSSLAKGDTQGVIDHVANLGVEGGKTFALGYLLTKNGTLVNTDAQGNNYDGVYVKIGNRRVPASTFGFFAPSLILGNAAYNGFHGDNDGKGVIHNIAQTAEKSLGNEYRSTGTADVTGAGSGITGPVEQAFTSSGDDPSKLIKVFSSVANQNIPAGFSDVNSFLNQSSLNKTHEAPETTVKAVNPDTGREKTDQLKSAEASVLSKIPFVSQTLPRKTGVASSDPYDKLLKSTRVTGEEQKAQDDAQATTDRGKADKLKDIPNPDDKEFNDDVQAHIENGKYKEAMAGLQQQVDNNKKDPKIPQSKNDSIETQIKQLKVTDDGGYEPKTIKLYKDTSLEEWRDMGDPESDAYDPTTYALLYRYDTELTKAGVSGKSTDPTMAKYEPKKPAKGSGDGGSNRVKGISSSGGLAKFDFSGLAPRKITDTKVPILQAIKPGELIKKRAISVGKA